MTGCIWAERAGETVKQGANALRSAREVDREQWAELIEHSQALVFKSFALRKLGEA
jgi:hypothetical protein